MKRLPGPNIWREKIILTKEKFVNGDLYRFCVHFGKQEKYISIQKYNSDRYEYEEPPYHKKFHDFTNLRYMKKWCDSWVNKGDMK